MWEANFLQKKNNESHIGHRLFQEAPLQFQLPELSDNPLDDLHDEIELLGFPLRNPFELVEQDESTLLAGDLPNYLGKTVTMQLYFIDYKAVPTKSQEVMSFGTFLDKDLNWVDTVHFPLSLRIYPMKGKGFYRIRGKVVEDFGVFSVEVDYMQKISYKERQYANL